MSALHANIKHRVSTVDVRLWRQNLSSNRFWVAFLVVFAGLFLHRSYLLPGTLNWGDWYWISPDTLKAYRRLPSMWEPMWGMGNTNAQINIGPIYWLMGILGALGVAAPLAERLLVFWPMSVLPFLSMYWFLGRSNVRPGARAAGAFVFGANTYMATRSIQHPFIVLGAGAAPLVWRCALDGLDAIRHDIVTKRAFARRAVLFGCAFALTITFDVRMALLALFPVLLFVGATMRERRIRGRVAAYFCAGLFVTAALQAYWALPALLGSASSSFGGKLPDAPFLNFYSLPHALALSEPYYNGNEPVWFSQNAVMWPLFALPILAFGGLVVARKRKSAEISIFAIVAVIGVWFTKGQNRPLGFFYNWAFTNIPGMQLFRDSAKFAVLIGAGYAVLIAVCLDRVPNWWRRSEDDGSKFPTATRQLRLFPDLRSQVKDAWETHAVRFLAVAAVAAFVAASAYGSRGSIADSLGGTSRRLSPPAQYEQLRASIDKDTNFGRVLWFPYTERWSSISDVHPIISSLGVLPTASALDPQRPISADPALMLDIAGLPRLADVLRLDGVKYIAVDHDVTSEMWTNTTLPVVVRQQYLSRILIALSVNKSFTQIPTDGGLSAFVVNAPVTRFSAAVSTPMEAQAASQPIAAAKTGQDRYTMSLGPSGAPTTVLRMSEQFNAGWKADIRAQLSDGSWTNADARHVELPDGTNGWVIDTPAGIRQIAATAFYGPQNASAIGFVIALVFLFAIGATFYGKKTLSLIARNPISFAYDQPTREPVIELDELDLSQKEHVPH